MKAVVFDGRISLRLDHPAPVPRPGWAVIAVGRAGVCRTDLEIVKGYMDFRGVLGHEFVGRVVDCDDLAWVGCRVVGEINAACGRCPWCARRLGRHCPHRAVLGIQGLDGCLAEKCALPIANLHAVPDDVSDDEAVFVEPLAAAFEILEQTAVAGSDRVVVLGDGKLGILCAWALRTAVEDVVLVGRHPAKLSRAAWNGVRTALSCDGLADADLVVEATGSAKGLTDALRVVRPRGVVVLKSTIASPGGLNLAPAVVNEVTIVGSRCGPFGRAIRALRAYRFPVAGLIDSRFPLDSVEQALARAAQRDALKVVVDIG
jgi:alcohol dehydrogenase